MAGMYEVLKSGESAVQLPSLDTLLLRRVEIEARERGVSVSAVFNDALNRYFSIEAGVRIRASWLALFCAIGGWGIILILSVIGVSAVSALEKALSQEAVHEEARTPGNGAPA